jgi:hypothetical protein
VRVISRAHARAASGGGERPFQADAHRYHAAVCALRMDVARRVERLLAAPGDHAQERATL